MNSTLKIVVTLGAFLAAAAILLLGVKYFLKKRFSSASIKKTVVPTLVLFGLLGLYYSLKVSSSGASVHESIYSGIISGVILQSAFLAGRILDKFADWYAVNIAAKTETKIDDEFLPLIRKVTKISVYVIAITMILAHFKINISALVATLGVGSLAVALASQEIFANMIAGFVIMVDRPFKAGDRVKLASGEDGIVFEIGIRSTQIKMAETMLIVSNSELMRTMVQKYKKE